MLNPDGHGSSCGLIDLFGRQVRYLRLSVTDRCDLRCVYCMSEHMTFMPRKDLLSLEELERLACAFLRCGVSKVRDESRFREHVVALALAAQLFDATRAPCSNGSGRRLRTSKVTQRSRRSAQRARLPRYRPRKLSAVSKVPWTGQWSRP
jgi:hypothetical protein